MKHYFERYCKDYENIENYEKAKADNFVGWCCHHRKGEFMPTKELKASKMYYHRPASELIFLTESEHSILHNKGEKHHMYGKKHSEETKKKIGEARKGKQHSEETKKKLSEAAKGKPKSEETKKKLSEAAKGKPKSEEHKKKISEAKKGNTATKGMHWYNNGKISKRAFECPDGFTPGRLKNKTIS